MLVGYARVSTLDQNPQLQIDAPREGGCKKIYSENTTTRSRRRAALQEALEFLRAGDTLVVWKLDRRPRSLSELIATIDKLHAADIAFLSLTDRIDTATPAGRVVFQITGAFSEFERSIIQQRTRAGFQAVRAAGKTLGRPSNLDPGKVKAAKAMLRDGHLTIRGITEQLDVSRSTLYRHFSEGRNAVK